MTIDETIKLLRDAGFNHGWALNDINLILWEHDAEPPAPLKLPIVEKPTKTAK